MNRVLCCFNDYFTLIWQQLHLNPVFSDQTMYLCYQQKFFHNTNDLLHPSILMWFLIPCHHSPPKLNTYYF